MKLITIQKSLLLTVIICIIFFIGSLMATHIITKSQVTKQFEQDLTSELEENDCGVCQEDDMTPRQELLKAQYIKKKLIALTFDDGPSKYTPTLVDALKKREIPVTFFVLGESATKFSDTLAFEYASGNEIGIHSYTHQLFTKLKEEEIQEQIQQTQAVLEKVTKHKTSLIRVPYGARNDHVDQVLDSLQLTDILWTVDSKDWKLKNTNKVYQYVLKKVKGNDIILMHDTFKTSIEAAIKVVDTLTSQCYTFVTVSELNATKQLVEQEK